MTGGLVPAGEPFESTATCDGSELEPDETCEFRYTYTVSLTGAGVAPIEVSSVALAFGAVVVDETAELDVTVTNRSTITRTPSVSAPAVESDAFAATSTCGGPLAAGASCAVRRDVRVHAGRGRRGVGGRRTRGRRRQPFRVAVGDRGGRDDADGGRGERRSGGGGSVATVSLSGQADPGGALVETFTSALLIGVGALMLLATHRPRRTA